MENLELKKVIHIENDELALNYKYRVTKGDLSDIEICSYEYDREKLTNRCNFYPQGSWEKGTYFLSPFKEEKNTYIKAEHFESYILEQKSNAISEIAQLLGASSYNFKLELEEEQKVSYDTKGEITYKVVEIQGSVKKEESKKLTKKFVHKETYRGKPVTMESYEEAKKMAEKYNLTLSPRIRTLLQKCSPDVVNKIETMEVSFFMTEEINNTLDTALNLNVANVFKLSAGYKKIAETRKSVQGILNVEFLKLNCDAN